MCEYIPQNMNNTTAHARPGQPSSSCFQFHCSYYNKMNAIFEFTRAMWTLFHKFPIVNVVYVEIYPHSFRLQKANIAHHKQWKRTKARESYHRSTMFKANTNKFLSSIFFWRDCIVCKSVIMLWTFVLTTQWMVSMCSLALSPNGHNSAEVHSFLHLVAIVTAAFVFIV